MVNQVSKTLINEITILKRVRTSHKVELSSIQRRGHIQLSVPGLAKIDKKANCFKKTRKWERFTKFIFTS